MTKNSARVLVACLVGLFALSSSTALRAEDFPPKPMTLIVPFGPGGATDIIARYLAEEGSTLFKQRITVFNKPGGSATLGTAEAFRAKADGYTVLLGDNISTVFQAQRQKLPYKGAEDFQPIIKVADVPNVLVVQEDAKWKSLDEFVADARANPGNIRVATAGKFTGTDLNMLELNRIAGIDTMTVPASGGTGATVTLLMGGHVEAIVAAPAAVASYVQAKKLRPLTVFAKQRIELFPDVPSTTEAGYKTTMGVMLFVSAPKNLDKALTEKLRATYASAIQTPRFQDFARQHGYRLDPLGPEPLGKELREWQRYFATLSEQLGIEAAD